jgi:hypothetical protein
MGGWASGRDGAINNGGSADGADVTVLVVLIVAEKAR